MAQKSRELSTFPEDQSLTPSPHVRQLTSASNSSSRVSDALFWYPQALVCTVSAHIDTDIYTYMKIIFKNLRTFCC